jgi:hypothetical protein
MPAFLLIARHIKHNIVKYENKIVISLLFFFFIFFCYLSALPKHGDFWGIISPGIQNGKTVYYNPFIGIFFEFWYKIGTIGYRYILFQYWFMIPFLLMLLFFIIISYLTLKNKWITFICFGTFSFISIIIMGQVDIWCVFWIYVAIILALKSLETEDNLKYIFSSVFALGLSMQLKPFGGLIFPVFFVLFLMILQKKSYAKFIKYNLLFLATLEFIFISILPSIIWPLFTSPPSGEAMWLFGLQLAPVQFPPYHTISIWLLGYVIIFYDLWVNSQSNSKKPLNKLFIFYIFATIAWFFIAVYSYAQWWILLVPPLLLVLDNFEYKINYVFYVFISVLFLFFSMQWGDIFIILKYYIPIFSFTYLFSSIVVTLISAILLIWIFELRKSLFTTVNEESIFINNNGVLKKIAPILPAFLIVFLFLSLLIIGPIFIGPISL